MSLTHDICQTFSQSTACCSCFNSMALNDMAMILQTIHRIKIIES